MQVLQSSVLLEIIHIAERARYLLPDRHTYYLAILINHQRTSFYQSCKLQ